MRLDQLHENHDFSPLTKIWKSGLIDGIAEQLRHMAEDEEILADVIINAREKYTTTAPEKLFDFIKPLIDTAHHTAAKGSVRSYTAVLEDLLNDIVAVVLKMDPPPIKLLQSKVKLDYLANMIDRELSVKLRLAGWKANRTKDEEKFDEGNQLYVFIGRPTFKERGDGSYRKTFEIERLVPIDRFDSKAHQMVEMMKLRARVQGEQSEVYSVTLPKGAWNSADDLDDWLIDLIDTHKKKVS